MELSRFFNSIAGDRRYLAEDWAAYFASFIGNGVFPQPTSGLQVIAGDIGTSVIIRAGRAWINGYFYTNEDELTLQIPIADGVLPRIDRIVIRWSLTERRLYADVKQGTPASNPQPPALQRDADIWELGIADVRVNAGATVITQANITDTRWNTALCGVVVGVIQQIDPTFITAQFDAFFAAYSAQIIADYAQWANDLQTMYATYTQLVETGFADFSSNLNDAFAQFMSNTNTLFNNAQTSVTTQYQQFTDLMQQFNNDSETAYLALLAWFGDFKIDSEAAFDDWFSNLQNQLDDNQASHLLNLIEQHEQRAVIEAAGVHGIRFTGGLLQIYDNGWVTVGGVRLGLSWRYINNLARAWQDWALLNFTWDDFHNLVETYQN